MISETPTIRKRNHAVWIGPLVAIAGLLSYFTFFVRFAALRDFPAINLALVLVGVAVSALAVWRAFARPRTFRGRVWGSIGLVFSLAAAALLNVYVLHLSYQLPEPTGVTMTLIKAPDFTLLDHTGQPVQLSALRGKKVVLTFYRGHW